MKKYIKNTLITFLIVSVYYLLSNQYDYYLKENIFEFKFISRLKIGGILLFILFLVFYKMHDFEFLLFKRVMKTIFYSIVFFMLFFFTFESFIKSSTLLLNRFSSKEIIEKPFIITYKNRNNVKIKSLINETSEQTENKFNQTDLKNIKQGDTIYIEFHKGLFGINYLKSKKIKLIKKE